MNSLRQVAKATGVVLIATTCIVAFATVLIVALEYLLLIFLGILLSVFLTKTSALASRYLPIGYGWNLALITSLLIFSAIGGVALFGSKVYEKLQSTSQKLDEGTDELVKRIKGYPLAMNALNTIPFVKQLLKTEPSQSKTESDKAPQANSSDDQGEGTDEKTERQHSSKASEASAQSIPSVAGKVFTVLNQILSTTLGLVANVGVILFVGIFIAVDPKLYRDGFARLFPLDRRRRVKDVLNEMGDTLFKWLLGRFMTMAITGVGTAAALFVLGVPLAITVGVITGLLTFVPNIGGITALFLAILVAIPQGGETVLWVVGLYAALQLIESNVITPLLQQHQTSIPPALLISIQVIMGAIAGFLGLMVATPLLAASLVLIQQVWIKDVLGEPSS